MDDATREFIDTSDTEERELLEAQLPGYHSRVWGETSHARMVVDEDSESGGAPVFVRTPTSGSERCCLQGDTSDTAHQQLLAKVELNNPSQGLLFQKVEHVVVWGQKSTKENVYRSPSRLTARGDAAHDGASNSTYDMPASYSRRTSTPPLEYPLSPSPDPLAFSPIDSDRSGTRTLRPNNTAASVPTQNSCDALLPTFHDFPNANANPDIFPDPSLFFPSHFHGSSIGPLRLDSDNEDLSRPLRFSSTLITPPSSAQSSSRRVTPALSPLLLPAPPSPVADPILVSPSSPVLIPPDPKPRAYSLRHRSAIQLNPFEYEKRMYKRQLRGLPEAIVKDSIVSVGRRERYRKGEEDDLGSQSQKDGDDVGDEWRTREVRREKMKQREIVDKHMQELGIVMPSDDHEGEVPSELDTGRDATGTDKTVKKRKRRIKARNFPMAAETETSPPLGSETNTLIAYSPRLRPIFHGWSPTPGSSRPAHVSTASVSARPRSQDLDFEFATDDVELIDLDSPVKATGEGRQSRRTIPIIVDDLEGQDYHFTNVAENDDFDGDQTSSEESSKYELTGKDRKRLKAMGRMMPAILMRKLLAEEQIQKRKRKNNDRRLEDSDDGEDHAPLHPGRGRKHIMSPSSKDPKRYEIRGDPESESEEERDNSASTHPEVVALEDGDGDESDDAERSLEESEERLDDKDIQAWLAPDLGRDASERQPAPRMRRTDYERDRPRGGDLIDRMLQRTNRVGQCPKPSMDHKNRFKARGIQNLNSGFALDIVTRDARRRGAGKGRQTKLTFSKGENRRPSGSAGPSVPSVDRHREHGIEPCAGGEKKAKKRTHGAVQTRLCVVGGHGQKVVSGRGRQIIHIDDNDHAFHEALAPEGRSALSRARTQDQEIFRNKRDILHKFRAVNAGGEPDMFDGPTNGGQNYSHVMLDLNITLLPSGMRIASQSYIGRGRLAQLVSILNNESEAPRPVAVTTFEREIDPDMPVSQISTLLATACDHLYDASVTDVEDPEMPLKMKSSDVMMYTLCQLVSFRAWCADDQHGQLAAAVSEQAAHLVGRIDDRLELVSADGHILDPRSFALYWFAFELELRTAFARKKRKTAGDDPIVTSTTVAEHYAVLLLRRLLEYGLDRTLQPLQNPESLGIASSDVRTIELWACFSHVAPFLKHAEDDQSVASPFWRIVEASMEAQSNKPDSSLDTSERIWRTIFGLCTLSQFSIHGLTMSTVRLEPHWPIVSKALRSIRLCADEKLDRGKSASTLKKRDRYVRLVTARCLLLDIRYSWRLHDADLVFRELCSIFRSRGFSNLLGEIPDFPTFIRERDEPLFNVYTDTDTAYSLFLKMIVRAVKNFPVMDVAARTRKLAKLLGIAVPVNSLSFTKASPPIGQELSMLYNRYSAIFVAIYAEPTPSNIHRRLQQVRRYVVFKDADYDSQAASIRAMMYLAILLRHLNQSLDDVLSWASEMMNDLLDNYSVVDRGVPGLEGISRAEGNKLVILIQLLLGSVRIVIENPTLCRSEPRPDKYPDPALLRADWIGRILNYPSLSADHHTGIEIRKCVQSFLVARSKVISPPPIPKLPMDQVESQDEYGDSCIDLDDPAVLALLDSIEDIPDENYVSEKRAADIMSFLAKTPICRFVFQHLGQNVDPRYPDSYFHEGDQWIECWLGCASAAVRNHEGDWSLHMTLWRAACQVVKNEFCRRRIFMRILLTVLKLDPSSYIMFEDDLLQVWFESIVSLEITIEHDFNGQLFSTGGLRHVLFRNFPCVVDINTNVVTLEKVEFERLRQSFIDLAISNVAENLEDGVRAERYISFLAGMLKTLRDGFESIDEHDPNRTKYSKFCEFVHVTVSKHERLAHTPILETALSWRGF